MLQAQITHIVLNPLHFLKIGETASPISFHLIKLDKFSSSSVLLDCPNCESTQETKSAAVMPSFDCDLTDDTSVLVRPSNASASATCSLGFCTAIRRWVYINPRNSHLCNYKRKRNICGNISK